jgi:hypothetical protein
MMLTLARQEFRPDGIFSVLTDYKGKILAHTLEHSYECKPKLYDGEFTCVRGQHQLEGMKQPFETFEITGVTGHTNILFHSGNWNDDSAGCVLVGEGIAQSDKGQMITASKQCFASLMTLLTGMDSFQLIVR